MKQYEQVEKRRRRRILYVVLACVAGTGMWLTGPLGVVLLTRGMPAGWALVAGGAILLAATVVAIMAAVRSRVVPESQPGRANPHFDEPRPSQNPRGGYSAAGTQLGSH
ncbi:hypothetical protein [Leifsonia sp. fls2-241-R2A-40a]|uniref:hypothetical protein n=1 Tax=Leifsonia sp. fls2-241-R2A-40a TaxID=3040290 RepID=UPI00254E29FD|nr:hypothetical protein [Leifsonia sp. fls2-241-R2A-40a]